MAACEMRSTTAPNFEAELKGKYDARGDLDFTGFNNVQGPAWMQHDIMLTGGGVLAAGRGYTVTRDGTTITCPPGTVGLHIMLARPSGAGASASLACRVTVRLSIGSMNRAWDSSSLAVRAHKNAYVESVELKASKTAFWITACHALLVTQPDASDKPSPAAAIQDQLCIRKPASAAAAAAAAAAPPTKGTTNSNTLPSNSPLTGT